MATTRRGFLIQSAAVLASAAVMGMELPVRLKAGNAPWQPGLQLYTVLAEMQQGFYATLKKVRAIGYKEVEVAGFFGRKPGEFKRALDDEGLHCRSVHIFGPLPIPEIMEHAGVLGARYIITSFLPRKRGSKGPEGNPVDERDAIQILKNLTLDDYKSMAERCNQMGEQARRAGLSLGYHNHNFEFRLLRGGCGFDELVRLSDANLVKFELDCGWVAAAGQDPAKYIAKYPGRMKLLHIKDFQLGRKPTFGNWPGERPDPAELGQGSIDYRPVFKAAAKAGVEQYYVEQEPPFNHMPPLEAIKVDFAYVSKLTS